MTCPLFFVDSIEGYTVDPDKGVIVLMERAKVDYNEVSRLSTEEVINDIKLNDGCNGSMRRKLNLAVLFGIPLHYVLYSETPQHHVWVYSFDSSENGQLLKEFNSFSSFGIWLHRLRTLVITKNYGHPNVTSYETSQFSDLPGLDQTLRKNQTPWLANLDAFLSDTQGQPIALIEFQKTKSSPSSHCNNYFYQLGQDLKRFETLEIARVHSKLPLIILVWNEDVNLGYKIKQVDCCAFPNYSSDSKQNLAQYATAIGPQKEIIRDRICKKDTSFTYSLINSNVSRVSHKPTLSEKKKTFPSIYYKYKEYQTNSATLLEKVTQILSMYPISEDI